VKSKSLYHMTALLFAGLLSLALAIPSARCQTQPTQAPKAAASAVYHLIEKTYTVKPDGSYTLISHVVIKILNYKGKKDHADFRYPFNNAFQSVDVLEARTLTADGRTIPATKKEIHLINAPEDAQATLYSRQRIKVVNFPSVEPGSTVEIKLKIQSKKGFWAMECFRLYDPIERKIVKVTLPLGTKLNVKLPRIKLGISKKQEAKTITYQWEARNVPRQVHELNLPPIENRESCLFLSSLSSWKDAARFFTSCLPAPEFPGNGDFLKGKTPDELYVALMKQFITYPIDFFHTALSFQSPAETLKKKYGSSMDLAILFYNLLRKRGFSPSYLMANTERVLLTPFKAIPFPPLFDEVMVRCNGKDYAFYVKDLPPGYTGMQGKLVLNMTEGTLTPAKTLYPNRSSSSLVLTPTGSFDLEGKFTIKTEGKQAVGMRSWLRYMTRDEWHIAALQILHGIDPLARSLGEIARKGLNILKDPVILEGKFKIPAQFPEDGGFMYIHLSKPDLPVQLETLSERRRGPFMIDQALTKEVRKRVILPEGMRVRYLPEGTSGTSKVMDWNLEVKAVKGNLIFHRVIHLKRGILYPGTKEYHDFLRTVRFLYEPSSCLVILEKK